MTQPQTGSEVEKPLEPNEAVTPEVTPNPEVTEGEPTAQTVPEVPVTPEDNVDPKLALVEQANELSKTDVTPEAPKTRKVKAIERSIASYEQTLDDEGKINFDKLVEEYKSNPKGLESFADKHGYDVADLQKEIDNDLKKTDLNYVPRSEFEELRSVLDAQKQQEAQARLEAENNAYVEQVTDLIQSQGLTYDEFRLTYGDAYDASVKQLSKKLPLVDAGKYAFLETVNNSDPNLLREAQRRANILANTAPIPEGNPSVKPDPFEGKIPVMGRDEVAKLPDVERIAYKKQHTTSKGVTYK